MTALTGLIKHVEAGVGKPTKRFARTARPTVWGLVATLLASVNQLEEEFVVVRLGPGPKTFTDVTNKVEELSILIRIDIVCPP